MEAGSREVSPAESAAISSATLVYAMQAISFLLGITFIVGMVINYVKRDDVKGTIAESHFTWQLRTFWYSLLWNILGMFTALVVVGYFVLLANLIWVIYRIVKGWMYLSERKPMYKP